MSGHFIFIFLIAKLNQVVPENTDYPGPRALPVAFPSFRPGKQHSENGAPAVRGKGASGSGNIDLPRQGEDGDAAR